MKIKEIFNSQISTIQNVFKRNDTEYIALLVIEALGIIIDGGGIVLSINTNLFLKILTYIMSILIPLIPIIGKLNFKSELFSVPSEKIILLFISKAAPFVVS